MDPFYILALFLFGVGTVVGYYGTAFIQWIWQKRTSRLKG